MPGKDTSSSSGKIFAKPSKEWVLPERAKPGRKASTQEPESKRQSQNRMSQRAHRARRTDYIQTLEERIRQYEADEIHSNVRLQEVARALKADNDKLKGEVSALTSALAAARQEREAWMAERRSLNENVSRLRAQLESANAAAAAARRASQSNKSGVIDERLEYELAALTRSPAGTPTMSPLAVTPRHAATATPPMSAAVSHPHSQPHSQRRPSAPSTSSAPNALACPICPDPDPDCPCQRPASPAAVLPAARGDMTLLASTSVPMFVSPKCGLCELAPEACICQTEEEDIKPVIPRSRSRSPTPLDDSPDCGLCTNSGFCACRAGAAASSSAGSDTSLPFPPPKPQPAPQAAQVAAPAVPLRLRARPAAKQSVWKLDNVPAGTSRAEAVCTGDPSNCDACRNDSFGREFCGHLFGVPDKEGKKGCAGCANGKCGGGGGKGRNEARSMSISSLIDGPASPALSAPSTPGPAPAPAQTPMSGAPLVLACCGAPELCGHAAGCEDTVSAHASPLPIDETPDAEEDVKPRTSTHETIRPDQAWKQLKAHPNAQFTPLAVLADVVARRTKCDGPRVELSPPPDERRLADARAIIASHAVKRRLAVETSAVRDALKYLDTHAPGSSPVPASPLGREAKRRKT